MKKEWLVDVPVKFIIWTRPECTKKGFEAIKKARPSVLFLVSDGPRNEQERELINESRKIVENIDWNCTVHRLYYETNQGMYKMMQLSGRYIFDRVDRCIVLEDDDIPAVSFFQFCYEMLKKYENDERIGFITGHNHLGIYKAGNADYFFSKEASIYGFAVWKRSYMPFLERDMGFLDDEYLTKLMIANAKSAPAFTKTIEYKKKGYIYGGHEPGEEFYQSLLVYGQNQLQIVPCRNMISNIGIVGDGAHTAAHRALDKTRKKLYCQPIYECKFPLKHPKYVVPDTIYEKKRNRLLAQGHPVMFMYRKGITAIKMFFLGDGEKALNKIIYQIKTRKTKDISET